MLLAKVRGEEIGEAEQHGHLAQSRGIHLACHAANAPVKLRTKLRALLRHLCAQRCSEARDPTVQPTVQSVFQRDEISLRGERIRGSSDLDFDGAYDRPRLRRCEIGLFQNV